MMREEDVLANSEARSTRSRAIFELLAATFVLLHWYSATGIGVARSASLFELIPMVFNGCAWLLWGVSAYFSIFQFWIPRPYDLSSGDYAAALRRRREAFIELAIDGLVAIQFLSLFFTFQRFLH